jgi:CheY-like chemotaxis protein
MKTQMRVILSVDDDADDQFLVHETIKAIDPTARVATAMNGLEALHYLSNAHQEEDMPCLIIMDINMPLMDGKETLARLKKESRYADIPVVMFTTSSSQLDKTFCEQFQIPFVTKPLTSTDLHNTLHQILSFRKCN